MKIKGLLLLLSILPLGSIAQTLCNGISLPKVWPPRYEEPTVAKEMDVPYLRNKPKVIPINVGRQLFVDSFLVAKTNLKMVFHQPNFYPLNPILKADKKWELTPEGFEYAAPFSDGIW